MLIFSLVNISTFFGNISAIKATTLKVTFNDPIDTTKATFELKNGSFLVPNTVAWNDAKTEASLTKTYGKYNAGEYTVAVKGIEVKPGFDTAKTTVEDERIENIKFNSTAITKSTDNTNGTIGYTVLNQYGEDITKIASIEGVSSFGAVAASEGVATITHTFLPADPSTASVTLYNGTKMTTATVTIADAAALNNVTLGSLILPSGTSRLIPSDSVTKAYVSFTAKDQYGNDMTTNLTGVTPVYAGGISGASVVNDPNDATKKVIQVTLPAASAITAKTTATLTLIVNNTGKASSVSFDMYPQASVADFTLTPDTKIIKSGAKYKVWIDAVDTYGNVIKGADLAGNDSQFAITSTNSDIFTVAGDAIVSDPTTKRAYIDLTAVQAGKTANLFVTLKATGKNASLPISVNAASEIVAMTLSTSTFNFAANGSATLKATFIDQYNEPVTDLTGYTITFTSDTTAVIAAPTAKTVAQLVKGITIAPVTNVSNATAKLTVTLEKDAVTKDGVEVAAKKTIDAKPIAIKVIDGTKTTLSYKVSDIDKLHGLGSDADATSDYAAALELTAKDAAGNTIYVPNTVIKSVASTNDSLVKVIKNADESYSIVGLSAGVPAGSTEASATLTIVVENCDGTVSIVTKNVTVSNAPLAAASLKAYLADGTEVTGSVEGIASAKAIDSSYIASDLSNATTFYFEALDQYGVAMHIPAIIVTNLPAGVTCDVTSGVITLGGTALAAGDTFNITAITGNGLTKTIKVVK